MDAIGSIRGVQRRLRVKTGGKVWLNSIASSPAQADERGARQASPYLCISQFGAWILFAPCLDSGGTVAHHPPGLQATFGFRKATATDLQPARLPRDPRETPTRLCKCIQGEFNAGQLSWPWPMMRRDARCRRFTRTLHPASKAARRMQCRWATRIGSTRPETGTGRASRGSTTKGVLDCLSALCTSRPRQGRSISDSCCRTKNRKERAAAPTPATAKGRCQLS